MSTSRFHLPSNCFDFLQDLLLGQQPLPYKDTPEGFLLIEAGAEEFLEGDYFMWIKFLGHFQSPC